MPTGFATPTTVTMPTGFATPTTVTMPTGFATPTTVTVAGFTTPTHWLVVPALGNAVPVGFHDVDLDFVSSMWSRSAEGGVPLVRARVALPWRALSILLNVNSQDVVDSEILRHLLLLKSAGKRLCARTLSPISVSGLWIT
jgi:hypothetical protein